MALKRPSIIGVALALAACGSPQMAADEGLNRIDREIERRKAENGAATAQAPGGTVERTALIGRWSDAPGCQDVITEFRDDGTFSVGPVSGTWELEGTQLTMTANGQARSLTVESVDSTAFYMTAESGPQLRSYRCTALAP